MPPQRSHDVAQRSDRPVQYLTVTLLLTAVVLAAIGWSSWSTSRRLETFTQRAIRMQQLKGRIDHLDEVLTMSARMAAASGDTRWEDRYLRFVPELDAAIAEARALVPDLQGTEQTDAANQQLVEFESRAFELVRQGESQQALAILLGPRYDAQKTLYTQGMDSLEQQLDTIIESKSRRQRRRAIVEVIAAALAIPLLAIGWIVVLRTLKGWRRDLLQELERREHLEGSVVRSTQDVAGAAAQIVASARQQEQTVVTFRAATARAAASVHEIAASIGSLSRTMLEVGDLAGRTANRATSGEGKLEHLDESMGRMRIAGDTLSAKIEVIAEASSRIDLATKVMVKVVDQTDLLAVNSSIEAEKAGEHAAGFRVVAHEIRRLAVQTAKATHEIETIVKGIHSSVSDGVDEVERFEQQMRQSVEDVAGLAQELGGIIEDVEHQSTRFAGISEAMTEQSAGADQIRDSIEDLSSGAEQFAASSTEFAQVTDQLHGVVQDLKQQVSGFGEQGA